MTKETLKLIHVEAMVCASSIKEFGPDRKYEWKLWGYLDALYGVHLINYEEYAKLKCHYHRYFKELSKQPKLGQLAQSMQDGNLYADDGKPIVGKEKENEKTNINN